MKSLTDALACRSETALSREQLLELAEELICKEDVLAFLQEGSDVFGLPAYFHQLGFYKFVLATIEGSYRRTVRLHYWKRSEVKDDIHDHVASFASKVLVGSLRNEIYSTNISGELFVEETFVADGLGCIPSHAVKTENTLELKSQNLLGAGATYYLNYDVLHRLKPMSENLITLIIQDAPVAREIKVYRRIGESHITSKPANPLTSEEMAVVRQEMAILLAGTQ